MKRYANRLLDYMCEIFILENGVQFIYKVTMYKNKQNERKILVSWGYGLDSPFENTYEKVILCKRDIDVLREDLKHHRDISNVFEKGNIYVPIMSKACSARKTLVGIQLHLINNNLL